MILQVFNGGLALARAPHLIEPEEAVIYNNIKNATGVLTPLKDKLLDTTILNPKRYSYFFEAGNEWRFSDNPTSWVEFQERLYWSDVTGVFKLQDGTVFNIGIDTPVGEITFTVTDAPHENTRANITTGGGGNLPITQRFNYRVVHMDNDNDLIADSKIVLESPTSTGTGSVQIAAVDTNFVSQANVYRQFDGFWRFVGSINTAGGSVTDNTYDISGNSVIEEPNKVNGTVQYALTYYNSVDGSESAPLITDEVEVLNGFVDLSGIPIPNDPQVTEKRLYRIGNNVTTFTRVTTLDNDETSYRDVLADNELEGSLLTSQTHTPPPTGLRFLTEYSAMLVGAVGDKLHFTPIGVPTAWPTLQFLDFPTTITGIAPTAGGLLVLTAFKTYLVTGTGPSSLAQQLLSGDQGCLSHFSIVERDTFAIWASTDGICTSDGGSVQVNTKQRLDKLSLTVVNSVLFDQEYYLQQEDGTTFIVDFARDVFQTADFGIESVTSANDTLYGYSDGKQYALYQSPDDLAIHYKSPKFILNGYTQGKVYDQLFINMVGTAEVSVIIGDEKVITKEFSGDKTFQLKFPNDKTRGESIQIEVEGPALVREIACKEGSANE